MTQKARVGPGILGFHPPLGYDVTDGRLVPIEAEAEVVREMFDLCLEGRTLEETAADLNANGRRTKRDTGWTPIKVYRILHNPVYAGFLRWDGIVRKADHDPLVAVEEFNEAQERLRSRAPLSNAHAPPLILPIVQVEKINDALERAGPGAPLSSAQAPQVLEEA